MKFLTTYRLASASLKAHRTRTMLTILGVVIGVFTITVVLLVGTGLRQSVSRQVAALDNNIILVQSNMNSTTGMEAFSPFRMPHTTTLNNTDVSAINKTPSATQTTPMMFLGGTVSSGPNSYDDITVVATNENLPATLNLQLASGEFFGNDDEKRNWVILGQKLASALLGTNQAQGQEIVVKGQKFIVVGILREIDQPISLAGADLDKAAIISLTNGRKFVGGQLQLAQILTRSDDAADLDKTAAKINDNIAKNHIDKSEYTVTVASDAAKVTTTWVDTITTAAAIFAGISLLVGGIGIMNIMLVSVTERTREIGIRKAVGATKAKILQQFLLEALIMTIVGGVIGVLLAYGAAYLIDLQFSLPLIFDWKVLLISLGIPLIVGIIFGIWPAWRAARQDPIVALRQYN